MEQPGFVYYECPVCEFSSVQRSNFMGNELCPVCLSDNGRISRMTRRMCRDTDRSEGRDARLEDDEP